MPKGNMKITTVNMPNKILAIIQKAIDMGLFPSRSEMIRFCVMEYMDELISDINEIDKMMERENIVNVGNFLAKRGFKMVRIKPDESNYMKKKKYKPLGNPFWKEVFNKTTNTFMKVPCEPEEVESY